MTARHTYLAWSGCRRFVRDRFERRDASARLVVLFVLLLVASGCRTGAPPEVPDAAGPPVFFPGPPDPPRIQFLASFNGADDVEKEKRGSFRAFVLGEKTDDQFRTIVRPYGIAARDGVIYVCDPGANDLVCLDLRSGDYRTLGRGGLGNLRKPVNVAVDEAGYKFVADTVRRQVVVFGPQDTYVEAFSLPGGGRPVDVAVRGAELYVLDNDKTPQVVVMERASGKVLRTFGSFGPEEGQFNLPTGIAVGPEGNIYISDTMNFRIQKLTKDGKFVWAKGEAGRRIGQFARPKGISVGPDGTVYVVDAATQLVQMFDKDGRILMHLGGPGNTGGALDLPASVAVDATSISDLQEYVYQDFAVSYVVLVTSQFGVRRVNVYAFGSFPDGKMPPAGAIETLSPPTAAEDSFGPQTETDTPPEPQGRKPAPGADQTETGPGNAK